MAWGLSNGYADLAYWGIATVDTTPVSDDNAPDPMRKWRTDKRPQASEPGVAGPTAVARSAVMESESSAGSGPGPEADVPPEPVWASEPLVTPKLATLPKQATAAVPPRIPNWERASVSAVWPDVEWEHASEPTLPHRSLHAHGRRSRRAGAMTAGLVLASLFVIFLAVTVRVVLLHHSTNTTPASAPTAVVTSSDSTRLVAATKVADRATSSTLSELHALKGIPTPVAVAAVVNPYLSALQRYALVLSGADAPATARTAAAVALAQVGDDVQSMSAINGLPALRLGSYLEQFGKDTAQFQHALATLEHDLGAPTT